MKLNPKKCPLSQKKFIGHTVLTEEIHITNNKTKAYAIGQDKHEVRSFMGICTYYRFVEVTTPLPQLTEPKRTCTWNPTHEEAFKKLKAALCSSPILPYSRSHKTFILDTNVSKSLEAVLPQIRYCTERALKYFSKVLTKPERNYWDIRKEVLAIHGHSSTSI